MYHNLKSRVKNIKESITSLTCMHCFIITSSGSFKGKAKPIPVF